MKDGRVESFVDAVRVQTENEILDLAYQLLSEGALAAATAIGGSALEVHLRRLVEKNELPITGHGTIQKYNAAIGTHRNNNDPPIYESSMGSQITSWGQSRNDAIHKYDQFKATPELTRMMLDGIRSFIDTVR